MKKAFALVVVLSVSLTYATDLRIYPSFSEVRQPVTSQGQAVKATFTRGIWDGIIGGSVRLEGFGLYKAVQYTEAPPPSWLTTQEGKTVYLTGENGKAEPVTLIRAADLMVKDKEGHYFTVPREAIKFGVLPPLGIPATPMVVNFEVEKNGTGTLTYLTKNISWTPRYELSDSSLGANLNGLADIYNNTSATYEIRDTELYAGDVIVKGVTPKNNYDGYDGDYDTGAANFLVADVSPTKQVTLAGSLGGLYKYIIVGPLALRANTITTYPFITPKLTNFERYIRLNLNLGTKVTLEGKGLLKRAYRLRADEQLAEGLLAVREDGRVVGEANLPNTRKGGLAEFVVGDDPDIEYSRTVRFVKTEKIPNSSYNRTTYQVTYSFESSKDRPIRAEVTENLEARNLSIAGEELKKNTGTMNFKIEIPANGKVSKTFELAVDTYE